MHDSSGNRTGGSSQLGRRGVMPGMRRHGFRVHKPRQPRHEFLDAPAVARPLLYVGAGNVPSMRGKRVREAYRSHSIPRRSISGRNRNSRHPRSIPFRTRPCNGTRPHIRSTGHGAPGAGACLRLQHTRQQTHTRLCVAVTPMRGNLRAARET